MQLLERRILEDGQVLPGGVLKVDGFLNHRIDPRLLAKMAEEWYALFAHCGINKILTIESSGIGPACFAGARFDCPILFAKKSVTSNLAGELYTAEVHSFTHGVTNTIYVSKRYLSQSDTVLIIDDFLANGEALAGLISLARQAGANIAGAGIAIEKAFQPGGERIRSMGVRVESLAKIASMDDGGAITFC